jgi:toxin-antitoxin system PIN domain toxin
MILPDVNVLVYAFRVETDAHKVYEEWLTRILAGRDELALSDHCLAGVIRVVTNPRVFSEPTKTTKALKFVAQLRHAARGRAISSTPATWTTFEILAAEDRGIKGGLIPDAYLAALALSHGCRLATADRGFARYPGLDFFDPATVKE